MGRFCTLATICVPLCLIAAPPSANAQALPANTPNPSSSRTGTVDIPLLESSRIFSNMPNGKTNEIYEGLINVHFPLFGKSMAAHYDQLGKRCAEPAKPVCEGLDIPFVHSGRLSFTMASNVRQLREDSAPVRTPSFMPRVRYTHAWTNGRFKDQPGPKPIESSRQWVLEVTPIGHYSNGQSGCLFIQQDAKKQCEVTSSAPRDAAHVNMFDGSFSSHYAEGALAWRKLNWYLAGYDDTRRGARSIVTAFVRVRNYSMYSKVPGGMNGDLRSLYGDNRIRVGGEFWKEHHGRFRGPWSIGTWIELANGKAPSVKTPRVSVEGAKTIDRLGGTGIFARWYNGHDDYNIKFAQRINVLQVGLTMGGEKLPTHRR